jgi:hypothetical protein
MAVNPISNTSRNAPLNPTVEANGSYTLPQQVYVPHPSLQQISTGRIGNPTSPILSQQVFNHPGITARPMPQGASGYPTHGIRVAIRKATPNVNGG